MFRKVTHASPTTASKRAARQSAPTVSLTETAPCEQSVRLQVPLETMAPVRAAVLSEFQRETSLPGFRKGKAPAELVERKYAEAVHEETLHRVTQQALEQVVKEHQVKPVGPFQITASDFNETQGLTIQATVEVEPAFALAAYKGIPLTRPSVEVTAEEIEQSLARLQESMAQLVPVGEGAQKERHVPPLDDELAKDLGFDTLEKLREHLTAKLREQKSRAQAHALESSLCDELLQRHTFHVPARLVEHQMERLVRDFKVRLLLSGVQEQELEAQVAKFTEQLRTSAEQRVKLRFILERIADQESATVTQDEVVAKLWQLAQRWKKDPAEVRKFFDAQGLWPSVVSTIQQEKTMARLMQSAQISDPAPVGGGGVNNP